MGTNRRVSRRHDARACRSCSGAQSTKGAPSTARDTAALSGLFRKLDRPVRDRGRPPPGGRAGAARVQLRGVELNRGRFRGGGNRPPHCRPVTVGSSRVGGGHLIEDLHSRYDQTQSGASESVRAPHPPNECCSRPCTQVSLREGPLQGQRRGEEKPRQPPVELPAQTPEPTHRYKPREVRRQGHPRWTRCPSRRVVVKLGSWSACADGARPRVGRRLSSLHTPPSTTGRAHVGSRRNAGYGKPRSGSDPPPCGPDGRRNQSPRLRPEMAEILDGRPSDRTFRQPRGDPASSRIDNVGDRGVRNFTRTDVAAERLPARHPPAQRVADDHCMHMHRVVVPTSVGNCAPRE